jgi:hypothetical protein
MEPRRFMRIPKDLLARRDLTTTAKLVYASLWDRAGDKNSCWPSQQTIADDVGISSRAVRIALAQLLEAGEIEVDHFRGRPNRYRLDPGKMRRTTQAKCAALPRQKIPRGAAKSAALPRQILPTNETNHSRPMNETKSAPNLMRINSEEIEAIYKAYPKHVGRRAALASIERALGRIRKADPGGYRQQATGWLLSRTQEYAASRNGSDAQFTPHPATWFNQDRFEDEPEQRAETDRELIRQTLDEIAREDSR